MEPCVSEFEDFLPVVPYEAEDEESEDVRRRDVHEQNRTFKISQRKHREYITSLWGYVPDVVHNVGRYQRATCDDGDACEEPSKHSEELEERDSIETDSRSSGSLT